ncbi:hypothetical protein RFI_33836, partial [Reticulomyxa filosa]
MHTAIYSLFLLENVGHLQDKKSLFNPVIENYIIIFGIKKKRNSYLCKKCNQKRKLTQKVERLQFLLTAINHFICLICKQVANNALESHCPQHEDMKESLIVGGYCLQQYLKSNSNSCPIQPHENSIFLRNKVVRQQIGDLIVLCPLQYGNTQKDESTKKIQVCNFKGKIKELQDHLHKSCPLKLLDCWFKPFGCNHVCLRQELNEHLISNIQSHFQLVIQFIQTIIEKLFQPQKDFQLSNFPMVLFFKKKNNIFSFFLFYFVCVLFQQQMIISEIDKLKKNTQNKDDEINKSNDAGICHNCSNFQNRKDVYFSSLKTFSTVSFNSFQSSKLSKNKTVCVWNVKTRHLLKCFKGHSTEVYSAKFSPYHYYDNRHLDISIRFWDFDTDREFETLNRHTKDVNHVQFSPFSCGQYLCSGSDDKTIHLWDIKTLSLLHVFNGHTNIVLCIDISPLQSNNNNNNDNKSNNIGMIGGNGYTICSGSYDKTIRIWDIETTKQLN